MNPYLATYHEYHRDNPHPSPSWTTLLELHLQHGIMLSTPSSFLLARPVSPTATLAQCLDPNHYLPGSSTWFVWWAHGTLPHLLTHADYLGVKTLFYQRLNKKSLKTMRTGKMI